MVLATDNSSLSYILNHEKVSAEEGRGAQRKRGHACVIFDGVLWVVALMEHPAGLPWLLVLHSPDLHAKGSAPDTSF